MSGWRERGYVQDSEEEDEGLDDLESTLGNNRAVDRNSRGLYAEVNDESKDAHKGLPAPFEDRGTKPSAHEDGGWDELHGDTLVRSLREDRAEMITEQQRSETVPPPTSNTDEPKPDNIWSQSSSPLSSLSSLSNLGESYTAHALDNTLDRTNSLGQRIGTSQPVFRDLPSGFTASDFLRDIGERGRRTFRKRNPIQLHPYLLEGEQYRQSLRARGLRPVAVGNQDSQIPRFEESLNFDQVDQYGGRDRSSSPFAGGSSSEAPSSPGLETQQSPRRASANPEDELPLDLDALFQRSIANGEERAQKRRKVDRERLIERAHTRAENRSDGGQEVFDVLESPRQRAGVTPHTKKRLRFKKFKIPRGFSVASLPTPMASTEAPRGSLHTSDPTVNSSSESDSPVRGPRRLPISSLAHRQSSSMEEEGRAAESESSSKDLQQIRRARKKIKGVLPASWIRLDKHAQAEKSKLVAPKSPFSDSPRTTSPLPSVHQDVRSQDADNMTGRHIVNISDDSESQQQSTIHRKNSPLASSSTSLTGQRASAQAFFKAGAEEGDWINPMRPMTGARKKNNSFRHKKQQTRLTDGFSAKVSAPVSSSKTFPEQRQRGLPEGRERRGDQKKKSTSRKSCSSPPKRSIIDATESATRSSLPDFVRVAIRQARKAPTKGKQSPSRKIFVLPTTEDTAEVNYILHEWRNGEPALVQHRSIAPGEPDNQDERAAGLAHDEAVVPETSAYPSIQHSDDHPEDTSRNISKGHTHSRKPKLMQTRLHAVRSERPPVSLLAKQRRVEAPPRYQRANKPNLFKRPGQLEVLQVAEDENNQHAAFRRSLLDVDDRYHLHHHFHSRPLNPMIGRFLEDEPPSTGSQAGETMSPSNGKPNAENALKDMQANVRRRLWKRKPRRLELRRSDSTLPNRHDAAVTGEANETFLPTIAIEDKSPLDGLGPYGTKFSVDCDIHPLPVGCYFHQSTLVGSGRLAEAMQLYQRDLDDAAVSTMFEFNGLPIEWCAWTANVSSQLHDIFGFVAETVEKVSGCDAALSEANGRQIIVALDGLKHITDYYSKSLTFFDPVDRKYCISQSIDALNGLFNSFTLAVQQSVERSSTISLAEEFVTNCLSYTAVHAHQLQQIADHVLIEKSVKDKVDQTRMKALQLLANIATSRSKDAMRSLIERCVRNGAQGIGGRTEDSVIEAVVVLYNIMVNNDSNGQAFWDLVDSVFSMSCNLTTASVQDLEIVWGRLSALLPALEFDSTGVIRPGKRFETSAGGWKTVKTLLDRTLGIYTLPSNQRSDFNTYIRTMFCRCYHLISQWGWGRAELVMGCIFDFFARRGLAILRNERGAGSPSFLENLNNNGLLTPDVNEPAFHIFLKILFTGLKNLRDVYPEKKVRNIAWRFIPNHGRVHKKEEDLRQEDLESLRNNHDLLCVLYAASPPSFRPNIDLVQGLVDFNSSHSEICRLNAKAWANLVRYQLSTDDTASGCARFAQWFNKILQQSRSQHRLARTEAEAHLEKTKNNGAETMTRDFLETAVASNQRQVEAIMSMTLASMANVLRDARNQQAADVLFQNAGLGCAVNMFDPEQKRQNKVVVEALNVYRAFFSKSQTSKHEHSASESNEDSQDYGDWSILDAEDQTEESRPLLVLGESMVDPLYHLLSNAFGADFFFDETLLRTTVDVWVQAIQITVRSGQKGWNYYVDPHGPKSWDQLRNTDQTRTFSPYYYASILEQDISAYEEGPSLFISTWITSLVARESMLKYQHLLTTKLMNANPVHPFLQNLPFVQKANSRYDVTFDEFRQSRLGVVSTVLANMRHCVEEAFTNEHSRISNLRQDCNSLLRQLMGEMKKNFQEIQHGSSLRGAYVEFVQKVIEFMQQYTAEVVPVDKFFTDSAAFPLPATDPTYVVGRLKAYGIRLGETRSQKSLAMFMQTASERAAMDNQQDYLVDQLIKSVEESPPQEDPLQPSLRLFLLGAVFPAYLDAAFSTDCGWILAKPFFLAASTILDNLIFGLDCADPATADATLQTLTALLHTLQNSLTSALASSFLPTQPASTLATLSYALTTLTALLPPLDYLHRLSRRPAPPGVANLAALARGALDASPPAPSSPQPADATATSPFAATHAFATRELRSALAAHWSRGAGDSVFFARGAARREAVLSVGTREEEAAGLERHAEMFLEVLGRMRGLGFGGGIRRGGEGRRVGEVVVI